MRGGATIRTGVALAVAMAGAARAQAQLPTLSIDDARVVERNGGPWDLTLTVTLSQSSALPVSASYSTVDGSALAGQDYSTRTGSVSFPALSTTPQTIIVPIIGDSSPEWIPTAKMDEAFFVQLVSPTNATFRKSRATVTIVDDDRPLPGLQLVSAAADGSPGSGRVRLQWRVPASFASGAPTDVRVRWNEGSSCTSPANISDSVTGEFLISNPPLPTLPAAVNAPGETQIFEHLGRPFVKHCYSLFAIYSPGGPTTERAVISATPFDATAGQVAWAYSTGYTDVVPPTVGEKAIYTVSTDGVVHAMERGELGGAWPAGWNPVGLGKPAHNRSAVVPQPYGQRLFVGTEEGEVHAVDGENGAIAWSRSSNFGGGTQLPFTIGAAQATPAGLFTSFGGSNDLILVGTNQGASNNKFYMLDPVTGLDRGPFYTHASMGGVAGMAAVDYPGNKVYFLTNSTTGTVFALNLGSPGVPAFSLPASFPLNLGVAATGSPVVRSGRIYFPVNTDLALYRLSPAAYRSMSVGDGPIKGFVFPDRRNAALYFSTSTKVWGFNDTLDAEPPPFGYLWSVTVPTPSIVLHWTGTDYLYVGGGDGCLYQFDISVASPVTTKKSVRLDSGAQIGAPSLDGPNGLAVVGSLPGVVYAVRVPFNTGDCP